MHHPPVEQMREAGYRAVDLVVQHLEKLRDLPVMDTVGREHFDADSFLPAEHPRPFEEVLHQVDEQILHYMARPSLPRFFAFIPGIGNYTGALADFLAHAYNVFAGSWIEAAGPAMLEVSMIDWLRNLVGLPDSTGGVFVSGGSIANLTALAAARDARLASQEIHQAVIYCSDQTHICVDRALHMLGFSRTQIRRLESDEDFRLPMNVLGNAIAEDRHAGKLPFCVVANAGTTNTGSVDPLRDISALCRRENLWLHVDGAYGASSVICDEGKAMLAGIELADSLALDPHKLFQPFACGCALVRDGSHLLHAFQMRPEYLIDVEGSLHQPNFWDYGPELTRPFRALKLWMTLQVHGLGEMRSSVEYGFRLARYAEQQLRTMEHWRIVTPARMGIVSFRFEPKGAAASQCDEWNRAAGLTLTESGYAFVISTQLRGQTLLRMCLINPRSTEEDVSTTLQRLDSIACGLAKLRA